MITSNILNFNDKEIAYVVAERNNDTIEAYIPRIMPEIPYSEKLDIKNNFVNNSMIKNSNINISFSNNVQTKNAISVKFDKEFYNIPEGERFYCRFIDNNIHKCYFDSLISNKNNQVTITHSKEDGTIVGKDGPVNKITIGKGKPNPDIKAENFPYNKSTRNHSWRCPEGNIIITEKDSITIKNTNNNRIILDKEDILIETVGNDIVITNKEKTIIKMNGKNIRLYNTDKSEVHIEKDKILLRKEDSEVHIEKDRILTVKENSEVEVHKDFVNAKKNDATVKLTDDNVKASKGSASVTVNNSSVVAQSGGSTATVSSAAVSIIAPNILLSGQITINGEVGGANNIVTL